MTRSSLAAAGPRTKPAVTSPQDRLLDLLAPDMARVQTVITERMASRAAPRIPQVTAHLIEAGGKRLRPLLTLAAARLIGEANEHPVRLAATVEFIHTATLLHDDVVDESDQRRGRPTANLLWDNQSSVLVGDYLFARAFELMVETGSLPVLGILSRASAAIAEGEVLQLTAARDLATSEATYLEVIRGKTAALFAAACEAGGVVAGASDAQAEALRRYGDALGIAFQIADDLLDYAGDPAVTGKAVGGDFKEGKLTLPLIKAVSAADGEERAFFARVIGRGRREPGDLQTALDILARRGALDATRGDALAWADRARRALLDLPASGPIGDALLDLADQVVERVR